MDQLPRRKEAPAIIFFIFAPFFILHILLPYAAPVVLIVAAIYLFIQGDWVSGIVLLFIGVPFGMMILAFIGSLEDKPKDKVRQKSPLKKRSESSLVEEPPAARLKVNHRSRSFHKYYYRFNAHQFYVKAAFRPSMMKGAAMCKTASRRVVKWSSKDLNVPSATHRNNWLAGKPRAVGDWEFERFVQLRDEGVPEEKVRKQLLIEKARFFPN